MFNVKLLSLVTATLLMYGCASAPPQAVMPEQDQAAAETAPEKSEARQRAEDLISGRSSDTSSGAEEASGTEDAAAGAAAQAALEEEESASEEAAAYSDMSADEKRFFENYLRRLKYMVVIKDDSVVDEFQRRTIITKGNEHLLRQGYDVVQYDQLVQNMEDQRTVYEAEAGAAMSLTQYIAQKLGADVYVELDCAPRSFTEFNRHYGEANFAANMFDPSTAELIGSITYRTDRSVSTSSEEDALLNALTAGTAQLMPRIIRDSTNVLSNRYSNGIRYQLILQNTPDARVISTFRRNLRPRVREILMGPAASDQMLMDVYLFGSISELEDAVYAAFDRTPGLESAYWVYTRGKTITFNSGN